MSITVGIGGSRHNASAALAVDGRLIAACEEERLTRARGVGSVNGRLPTEAVKTVLALGHASVEDVSTYITGETGLAFPSDVRGVVIEHHRAHAASAFLTSPLKDATVLVCDRHSTPELSVWSATPAGLNRLDLDWHGPAFATLYSQAAEALGFRSEDDEHRLEALARIGQRPQDDRYARLISSRRDHLEVSPSFQSELSGWNHSNGQDLPQQAANIAHGIQERLGELLLDLIDDIRKTTQSPNICLAGGLFYNSHFNSVVQASGLYEASFVPIDPGNPGLAVGAAMAPLERDQLPDTHDPVSPFLGTQSTSSDIKTTLENCKLSYHLLDEERLIGRTVDALAAGHLVGWFQGRMEWGPRALGNRSILASPLSPYVAENLNVFLKHRERYRSYGVSVCHEDAGEYFEGSVASPFMEREYHPKDPDLFSPDFRFGCSTVSLEPVAAP